nr:hypothetical protein [Desulfobacula sp.]
MVCQAQRPDPARRQQNRCHGPAAQNYPHASPIGFYLKAGANTGGLDTGHLYNAAYHGAIDLSAHGWQWFCGIAEGWKPGRHNLVTYLSMVLTMLAEQRRGA